MNLLKIAICDDSREDRDNIIYFLGKIECELEEEFEIISFDNGKKLCESIENNNFDIILLDIVMDKLNGIETAKQIRSMGEDSRIIFVSSYDDKLRDLFKFGTIAFIDKPIDERIFKDAIIWAYKSIIKDSKKVFIYNKNKNQYAIALRDIVYFEVKNQQVYIITRKETIVYNERLKNIWKQLKNNIEFIYPNQSYILNLKYSLIQNTKKILINSEFEICIGRKYKEDTMKRYMLYLRRRI